MAACQVIERKVAKKIRGGDVILPCTTEGISKWARIDPKR